jgi:hypothetical protein
VTDRAAACFLSLSSRGSIAVVEALKVYEFDITSRPGALFEFPCEAGTSDEKPLGRCRNPFGIEEQHCGIESVKLIDTGSFLT